MMNNKHKRIIFRAFIGLIIAAIILILIVVFIKSKKIANACEFIDNEPEITDPSKLSNYVSQDYRAIGNFFGYLQQDLNSNTTYLPLKLELLQSECTKPAEANESNVEVEKLIIRTDCASLELELYVNAKDFVTSVSFRTVHFKTNLFVQTTCTIKHVDIDYPNSFHFRLRSKDRTRFAMPCVSRESEKSSTIWLVILDLEFEISDDTDVHMEKKFNLPPYDIQ